MEDLYHQQYEASRLKNPKEPLVKNTVKSYTLKANHHGGGGGYRVSGFRVLGFRV